MTEKTVLRIFTDSEWEGVYNAINERIVFDIVGPMEIVECDDPELERRLFDITEVISLGDILPTGTRKGAGKKSLFKQTVKELSRKNPGVKDLGLKEQLDLVCRAYPDEFFATYGEAHRYIKESAQALRNASGIKRLVAITGNREFDYQLLLDFLADRLISPRVSYMDELMSISKVELHTKPAVRRYCSTGVLFLPYSPKPEELQEGLEKSIDKLRDMKTERVVVMTHENPNPQMLMTDRKVKMKKILDYGLTQVGKFPAESVCFCGHLDIESMHFPHNGVKVQPVSSTQIVQYETETGKYQMKSHLLS